VFILGCQSTDGKSILIMNQIQGISNRAAWLLIAVVSLSPIGLHAQSGAVLCIESDGHFTIELAAGTRCAEDDDIDKSLEAASRDKDDHEHVSDGATHCDDCIDVILRTGADEDCVATTATSTSVEIPEQTVAQDLIPVQRTLRLPGKAEPPGTLATSDPISILSTVIFLT
jgi:hypothetical protein